MSRPLNDSERAVLDLIRKHHGPQNTEDDISWVEGDEAVLWIKNEDGEALLVANLTNLASWHADGGLSTEKLHEWLGIPPAG